MYTILSYYIRKDQLEKEYLVGLQQRKIDEKFHYIGERQADSWFNICNSPEYTYYENSKKLLEDEIEDLVSDHKGDVNVIALGPGDALKEKVVVDHLLKKHQVCLFFIDTSRDILNVAINNLDNNDILKEAFIADLKNFMDISDISHHTKKYYHATNFFTLLGNTLGNYPQAMILTTIRSAMSPGDKILIDVRVTPPENDIEKQAKQIAETIQEYDNPNERERILASLSEAGIKETDGVVEVESNSDKRFPQMRVVEQYFCFTRNRVVSYQGTDIYFAKGERILVGYSNKYTFESLKNLLTSHGLHIIKHAKDDTGKYYQVLCELA